MPARERWSRENPGTCRGLHSTTVAGERGGGGGEGRGFSYLLESHMTYLAGSHVLRSWPGIRLKGATRPKSTMHEQYCPLGLPMSKFWLPTVFDSRSKVFYIFRITPRIIDKTPNFFKSCLMRPRGVVYWKKTQSKYFWLSLYCTFYIHSMNYTRPRSLRQNVN